MFRVSVPQYNRLVSSSFLRCGSGSGGGGILCSRSAPSFILWGSSTATSSLLVSSSSSRCCCSSSSPLWTPSRSFIYQPSDVLLQKGKTGKKKPTRKRKSSTENSATSSGRKGNKKSKAASKLSKGRLEYLYSDQKNNNNNNNESPTSSGTPPTNTNNNTAAAVEPTSTINIVRTVHVATLTDPTPSEAVQASTMKAVASVDAELKQQQQQQQEKEKEKEEAQNVREVTDRDEAGEREAQEENRNSPSLSDDAAELDDVVRSSTLPAEEEDIDGEERGETTTVLREEGAPPSNPSAPPEIGSLLDFESAINLRLATLTQQGGRAFRALAVRFPLNRASMDFEITFEDIGSGAQLVCTLSKVKTYYMEWASQFRASFIALFLPTLQHPNATLLMNAIFAARPGRSPPPAGSYHPRLNEDADHLFFSYQKLREVISKKKKETNVDSRLLNVTVLNAYPEEWKNYIHTPGSCAPQAFLQAAYNFRAEGGVQLNKELLHAQLSSAAECMSLFQGKSSSSTGKGKGGRQGGGKTSSAATLPLLTTSATGNPGQQWQLVFVSAPVKTAAGAIATPPMQNLLTGEFIDPMTLSMHKVVYIIGTGTAAESFATFPLARKGKKAYSILLQDIESQLGVQRPHRVSLTNVLTQALDNFSRLTWMGLMKEESDEVRVPHPTNAFYKLQRRTVQREILPSFFESVFSPSSRLAGRDGGGSVHSTSPTTAASGKPSRRLEEYIAAIFNTTDRLDREKAVQEDITACKTLFLSIQSAGVTAARRADNPFSEKNGIVSAQSQYWPSVGLFNPPEITVQNATENEMGGYTEFLNPDSLIPEDFPLGPSTLADKKKRACNGIIVAWDAKRVLLFMRHSKKLNQFILNGGRIWCAQYAQYILKGFNHHHLSSMERTVLQYHAGPMKGPMHPLEKLKLIYQTQLNIAVHTRQLISVSARMDGLLASAEMEKNGLQLVPQDTINAFSENLKLDHDRLEKLLQEKVQDFTKDMDDEVRLRINFRSPQDISTIIYGGALCRHLGSRFVPVRPTKYPITCLFPHAVCKAAGCPVPDCYRDPASLLPEGAPTEDLAFPYTPKDIVQSIDTIDTLCKKMQLEHLEHTTAVVVVIVKAKTGGFIDQLSLFCPSIVSNEPELNLHVAVEDILPVAESPDLITVTQLKRIIREYKPLRQLQPLKKYGKKSYDVRNVLIVTNCAHERLEPLVDAGIISEIEETILGPRPSSEAIPLERVCFADLQRAFPPPPQGTDSFESDFSELTGVTSISFSAKANWEAHTSELQSMGGYEGVFKALVSHCSSVIGTPRDAFRNTHPVPSALPRGIHGQEQASTDGMLWLVTPPSLHPMLRKFLAGRAASSGADAMERVTVLLSPYQDIDLSFFSALQQLRFTEKKMQLFDEGCLFRAVLPENHERVHGELCHCVTATGRLSSQSPNLQNIPKEQDLRRLIVSRFGTKGRMVEADYSQLEVVVLAALSRDPKMRQELQERVDFHCVRVSLMTKEPYEEVIRKVKVEKDPQYIQLRQQAKVFSFQRQYGAGVNTIATTTGLTEQEVDRLIAAEEHHYKDLGRYYRLVMDCVEGGADRLLRMRTLDLWEAAARRVVMLTEPLFYFVVPTGSKYDFTRDRKSVPKLKNYPVQGLAGEVVQIMCGKILRLFLEKKNYNERAFLVNTVHDCVWVDCHQEVAEEVAKDLETIMTSTRSVIDALFPELKLDVGFAVEVKSGPSLGEL